MNPLAEELNAAIKSSSPAVYECLSSLGKRLFFPKGILSQSAEASLKANRFNATIGTATEKGGPMYLRCTRRYFNELEPKEIYPYAPPKGRLLLRELWHEKIYNENPGLYAKNISLPIVTSAITHGLNIVADLFVDEDDRIILPDQLWGNYRLIFSVRKQARIETFNMFDEKGGLDLEAFRAKLEEQAKQKQKLIVLLNFPNNPTGYTPTVKEAEAIYSILKERAEAGTKLVVVTDDSYFGLFYENTLKESLFSGVTGLHENILAIKLDGATKEDYAWGFRTGFITFGSKGMQLEELYEAIEKKVAGSIRGLISNCNHVSQTIVEKALQDPRFKIEHTEKFEIMKKRAQTVKECLADPKFEEHWDLYPFNSGYFLCLKLKKVDAEKLRNHLLDDYGVGTIANNATDLRIAISCIEAEEISELFDLIYKAAVDLAS